MSWGRDARDGASKENGIVDRRIRRRCGWKLYVNRVLLAGLLACLDQLFRLCRDPHSSVSSGKRRSFPEGMQLRVSAGYKIESIELEYTSVYGDT